MLLPLLLLLLVFVLGCDQPARKLLPSTTTPVHIEGAYQPHTILKFEFEGHQYLFIDGLRQGGLEHDPDCSCHAK